MSEDPQSQEQARDRVPPRRIVGLAAGPLLAGLLLLVEPPAAMSPEAWRMAAITSWVIIWWLTEAIPIPATALLPLVLMPSLGVQDIAATASNYAGPLIFLFLGGFLLSLAMQRVGLHRRMALAIVAVTGTTPARVILGFMLATAFLSMWISNTAATILMFAVALSVVGFVAERTPDNAVVRNFGVALMLSIAYSASIGGIGTLIGSPPNGLLASFAFNTYGIEISFLDWMMLGLPMLVVMLPLTWLMLTRLLFPASSIAVDDTGDVIRAEQTALGRMNQGEYLVAAVFAVTALGWILRDPLSRMTGIPLHDATIAIAAAVVLFAVPVASANGRCALDWQVTRDLPWGVLILLGGGLSLAGGFASSGLAAWIGEAVAGIEVSTVVLVLVVLAVIAYLTELTSNTAVTATFLPILGAVATGLGIDVLLLAIPAALAASMAFMLPVATPPNAIVFAYDQMRLADMVRAGFLLNFIGIATIFSIFLTLGRMILGIPL